MDRFSFGPRDNEIIQIAYTVAEIQDGMRHYSDLLHVGPWFLVGPFVPPKGSIAARQPRCRSVSGSPFPVRSWSN